MSHAAHIASSSYLIHQFLVPQIAKKVAPKTERSSALPDSRAVLEVNADAGNGDSEGEDAERDSDERDVRDGGNDGNNSLGQGFDLMA